MLIQNVHKPVKVSYLGLDVSIFVKISWPSPFNVYSLMYDIFFDIRNSELSSQNKKATEDRQNIQQDLQTLKDFSVKLQVHLQ